MSGETLAERLKKVALALAFYDAHFDSAPRIEEIVDEIGDIARELERTSSKGTYAMVVIVEAEDSEDAHSQVADSCFYAEFVGDPWPVAPTDHVYDTETCLRERRKP